MILTMSNIWLVFKDQLPFRRLVRNLWKGHSLGLFHINSHVTNGKPKVMYNTKESSLRAAESMAKKHGKHFSSYKCLFCTGYHVGKNRENK